MNYFVFVQKDKGGCFIFEMSKDELERALGPGGEWQGRPILTKMPDWDYTADGIVIIKGDIIAPRPVAVVTEYRVP